VWLLLLLTVVAMWLSLGQLLLGAPHGWEHVWLPWRSLAHRPVLEEILPDQLTPFITLFIAFLVAIGLDAAYGWFRDHTRWSSVTLASVSVTGTVVLSAAALIPVFATFDIPFAVTAVQPPAYMRDVAPTLPHQSVLLTIPFAISGSTAPMYWQADATMAFQLAGAAMKTPNAVGGPVGQGAPGSARNILSDLSLPGSQQPTGTRGQIERMRAALAEWHVTSVVIDGPSPDPVYASGFFTVALGFAPTYTHGAWVWNIAHGPYSTPPAFGASLYLCRLNAAKPDEVGNPLSMSQCVLTAAAAGPQAAA
jgi:hypothetical protein